MLRKLLVAVLLLIASSLYPLFADYSDLQTVGATVQDNQVTVQVHNPTTTTEAARIQVSVRVDDGSTEVLTVPTVTVDGSVTVSVTASASKTIVEILDDPQPISP